jgi:hypothetical protein
MFANNGHAKVTAVSSTVLAGKWVAENTGGYSAALGLSQQLFPLFVGKPIAFPIRSSILAPMIEKSHIVVTVLEWLDIALNKTIHLL